MTGRRMACFMLVLALSLAIATSQEVCKDLYPKTCRKWLRKGYCENEMFKPVLQNKCRESCGFCDEQKCVDLIETRQCTSWANMDLCGMGKVGAMCAKTCNTCKSETHCPRLSIENGKFVTEEKNRKNNLSVDTSKVVASGTGVKIECNSGYELLGQDTVTCLDTGEYDGKLGVCVRQGLCEIPHYGIWARTYFLLTESMAVDKDLTKVSPGTFGVLLCVDQNRKLETFCTSYGTWLPSLGSCDDDSMAWEPIKYQNTPLDYY